MRGSVHMRSPMRCRHSASVCALLLGLGHTGNAQDARSALAALPGSTLTIRGSTTIGAHWSCTATDIVASAGMEAGALGFTPDAVRTVSVNVLVSTLRCQSGRMERAMRKAMRADKDSTSAILGDFATHAPHDAHAAGAGHLDGAITVAGVQRPVTLKVLGEPLSDSVFRVRSSVPLALSSFDITPPRVLFGAVRARDSVSVEVDLRFPRPPTRGHQSAQVQHRSHDRK